ncbi:MAG: SDR family oxidoreductase [Pirellulaceae bacterium]|nr:SDR family oxidoreductase [Pirellulaceae bacterium]
MDVQKVFGTSSPVVLVTGAGAKRVGRAIVHRLANGPYRVAIHANRSFGEAGELAAEIDPTGKKAIVVQADLQNSGEVKGMVDSVVRHFGRIDGLVNSAAIWEKKELQEVTPDDLRRHFEINSIGLFVCAQQVGLVMVRQKTGGVIVNLGDWATVRPYLNYAAYFPSKGAVETITKNLAVELGKKNPNIRVNAILPGPVLFQENVSEEEKNRVVSQTLLQKGGTADHIAHTVEFLLENDFITGVCLPVEGGRRLWSPD